MATIQRKLRLEESRQPQFIFRSIQRGSYDRVTFSIAEAKYRRRASRMTESRKGSGEERQSDPS